MASKVKVCVIGAGAAGLCAARHLGRLPKLFTVNVFEQTDSVGGTWVYTPDIGVDKNGQPIHQSMYKNLRTNLPKEIMRFPDFHFDPHLPSFIHHTEMAKYLQQYAEHFNLISCIQFNTAVLSVKPADAVHTPPLIGEKFCGSCELPRKGFCFPQWKISTQNVITKAVNTEIYDAVLVCNGHYSTPFAMDVPGMKHFPAEKLTHSHSYRDPKCYHHQVVLVIGAGSSGKDIMFDVATEASHVVLSNRKGPLACPLPSNAEQFVEVEQVLASGVVLFKDGRQLSPDAIIMCNGYDFSFPFLDDSCGISVGNRMIHPLHKHVFNSAYPSMAFVGMNITVLPFPYFDVQARWVFSVWSGVSKLPLTEEMVTICDQDWAKLEATGTSRRYAHRLASMQWDYYHELALMSANQPMDHVLQDLYTTVYQYRATDLIGYKDYQFVVTGHSSFLLLSDSAGPLDVKQKLKVAVIGGGTSGLCAVRHCSKFTDCISVTLYDDVVGAKCPPALKNGLSIKDIELHKRLRTSLPRDLMGFDDFAFPPNADSFPTQSQVVDYLWAYCRHYGVLQHVRFGDHASRVSLQECGVGGAEQHKWVVEARDVTNGRISCHEFDKIFISAECFREPFVPPIEGLELFPSGHIIHSSEYHTPHPYKDKVVLVIDNDSRGDVIITEVAPVAKETIVISKQAYKRTADTPHNIQYFPKITKVDDKQTVQFSHGTNKHVDMIILCSRYKYEFPCFHDSYGFDVIDKHGIGSLYKSTFNPHDPSMVLLGTIGDSTFGFYDMQVMWALRVWLGMQPLPHSTDMLVDCKNEADTEGKDLTALYKELASYSKSRVPSSALLGILKEINGQAEKKAKNYTVLSSEHWIVTNN